MNSKNMKELQYTTIKLRYLKIQNFKGLDSLELEIPPPRMAHDPDILVMGSRNGLGKTSVLEACALLFFAATSDEDTFRKAFQAVQPAINLYDLLIRVNTQQALIEGTFELAEGKTINLSLTLDRQGDLTIHKTKEDTQLFQKLERDLSLDYLRELVGRFFALFMGLSLEPLLAPPLLYFHSYRKVGEGNLELGQLVRDRPPTRFHLEESRTSRFKLEIMKALMGEANLFEDLENTYAKEAVSKLNELIEKYAQGNLRKLRPVSDNTVELRFAPTHSPTSFNLDGLSSGQKEIVSTLFLIWNHSRNISNMVLIDEPELHFNIEWQDHFINQLYQLAPSNQYIIATHAEEIFSAVDQAQRILLT